MTGPVGDHHQAGPAIRAALPPGETLWEHCALLRSPGLEREPPGTADLLSVFNPFQGFGKVTREDGLGMAMLAVALGEQPDDSRSSDAWSDARALRRYGRTFCGVPESTAGRLLAALRRYAPLEQAGDRPAWAALTDRRLVVYAETDGAPRPQPGVLPAAKALAGELLRLGPDLWRIARGGEAARRGFSGPVFPIFECPPGSVIATPAPPVGPVPRVVLWFHDGSWLVVSLGSGAAGLRVATALGRR